MMRHRFGQFLHKPNAPNNLLSCLSRSWAFGRVTLVGDAAHPILPHRGMGTNLGVLDGICLANIVYNHLRTSGRENYDISTVPG